MLEFNTFSISARCARSGMLGVAVATALPGVGGLCPFVAADVGAISTQSWVNPYLGIDGLTLLREGKSAEEVLQIIMRDDPGRSVRQIGMVDARGGSAAWSGEDCTGWYGHVTGSNYSIQGNMLVGEATLRAMEEAFLKGSNSDLSERLLTVLEAGQSAGGDKRGRQSAALLVHKHEDYPYLSLRVDEHSHPIQELRRVFDIAREQLLPFVDGLPSRANPLGNLPTKIVELLMLSPPLRRGGGGSGLE